MSRERKVKKYGQCRVNVSVQFSFFKFRYKSMDNVA